MLRIVAAIVLTAACRGDAITWTEMTQEDVGTACIEGGGDAPAVVKVNASICLSSSCSRRGEERCEVVVEGDRVVVTSFFSWEEASGNQLACTDDCGQMIAECGAGELPAGAYTLVHGTAEVAVELPAAACTPGM